MAKITNNFPTNYEKKMICITIVLCIIGAIIGYIAVH